MVQIFFNYILRCVGQPLGLYPHIFSVWISKNDHTIQVIWSLNISLYYAYCRFLVIILYTPFSVVGSYIFFFCTFSQILCYFLSFFLCSTKFHKHMLELSVESLNTRISINFLGNNFPNAE